MFVTPIEHFGHFAAGGVALPRAPSGIVICAVPLPDESAVVSFEAPDLERPQSPGPLMLLMRAVGQTPTAIGAPGVKPEYVTVTTWPPLRLAFGVTVTV